jgi:hypothetical protein
MIVCHEFKAKFCMAHIWNLIKKDAGERWDAAALAGEGIVVTFRGDGVELESPAGVGLLNPDSVLILPAGCPAPRRRWTLLSGRSVGVRVNGQLLALGIRALEDKDEILAGGHRMFFSAEEFARVVPFPGLAQPAFCPRCKQKIEPADLAVRCPTCHAWSHQSEKFPCWTYDTACAFCQQQSTALDAGFNFNPATL